MQLEGLTTARKSIKRRVGWIHISTGGGALNVSAASISRRVKYQSAQFSPSAFAAIASSQTVVPHECTACSFSDLTSYALDPRANEAKMQLNKAEYPWQRNNHGPVLLHGMKCRIANRLSPISNPASISLICFSMARNECMFDCSLPLLQDGA